MKIAMLAFMKSVATGLDVIFTEKEQEKVFLNGVKQKNSRHNKIYADRNKNYTDFPIAILHPYFHDNEPYIITAECETGEEVNRLKYLCLKPAAYALAEPINQNIENETSEMFLPPIFFLAVSVFFVCNYIVVIKFMKLKEENKLMKVENKHMKEKLLQTGVLEIDAFNKVTIGGK